MKPKLLTTLVGYDRGQFAQDAVAGATVALVALPDTTSERVIKRKYTQRGVVRRELSRFI
jgi:hypothetical protein